MRVLVACEFSGIVRDAFRERGHDAWSCDLLDSEGDRTYHLKGDVLDVLDGDWDLMVAHPPCTHLAVSGARWFAAQAGRAGRGPRLRPRPAGRAHPAHRAGEPGERHQLAASAGPTRSSSRGSSATARSRRRASGSRTCRSWCPRTSWRAGRRASTGCLPARSDGRSAAGRYPVSPPRWRSSGA